MVSVKLHLCSYILSSPQLTNTKSASYTAVCAKHGYYSGRLESAYLQYSVLSLYRGTPINTMACMKRDNYMNWAIGSLLRPLRFRCSDYLLSSLQLTN